MEEIGLRFGISTPRVSQIVNKNLHLLKINQTREKIFRINKLKRILSKKGEICITKDAVDILDKLRVEVEGKDGSEQMGRADTRIIIIRADQGQSVQVQENKIAGMSIIRPVVAAAVEDPQCQKSN
jgi:DNA-directed RNA polymerase sigma subunit (sigma70/sigma32)